MRPHLPFDRRWFRTGTFRLRAVGVALALGTGLTVSAVSASAATGSSPGGEAHGHGALRVTSNAGVQGTPTAGAAAAARPQLPRSATVTLPTGDRVRLEAAGNGSQQATPVPATVHGRLRAAATFMRFTWHGDQYVIPDQAVPYLHSTLDPRLFDVSYLARARLGTGSTGLPLRITYTSPAATASLPGVRVARRTGATATATITAAQAGRLGQLLATQWHAARTGRSRTPAGQLPGIKHITLAPPRGAPALPASPTQIPAHTSAAAKGVPYYTLTINATDLNGNPGTFGGIVQNVDNAALFDQDIPVIANPATGSESLSVPKGTYSLAISIVTPDPSGTGFDTALVVKPQVTVDSDTTVSLDARTAVPYSATPGTPVNASVRTNTLNYWRTSASGGGNGPLADSALLGLVSISPNPAPRVYATMLRATPTAPVTKGSFLFDASTVLSNTIPGGSQGPDPTYIYDFPHQGSVPSSLTYTVPAANLTTVHEQTYNSPSGCGSQGQAGIEAFLFLPHGGRQWFPVGFQEHVPAGERTDYWYSSDPRLDLWQSEFFPLGCSYSSFSAVHTISPGQQITETWNKAPLVPTGLAYPYEDHASGGLVTGDPRLTVCAAGETTTTDASGHYSITLPPASYQVTAGVFGYQSQTQTVTVTAGQTTTANFALTPTPHVTVSGTVTPASGTAWPLYAKVTWTGAHGQGGTTFTDPATGKYSLSVLANGTYALTVTPLYPGYTPPASATVTVGTSNVTQDFTAGVDMTACTAIGYHPVLTGTTQPFTGTSAPTGWRVTNINLRYPGYSYTPGWVFTNPAKRSNSTGGTGNFAIVDSAYDGPHHYQDTELTSPAVNLTGDKTPALQFATDLEGTTNTTATVSLSTDGGKTWTSVWTNNGAPGDPGPATVAVPLPQAAGKAKVKARFTYTGENSNWWEIDNVFLGNRACTQQTGGLLVGRVADASGNGINGATVTSVTNPAETATTVATPGDSAVNGGLYDLFVTETGSQQYTASANGYTASTQSAAVTAGQVSMLNFTMTPG